MTEAPTPTAVRKVRPFYWSVRRELWENPALYVAPAAVAGVILFGALIGAFLLPGMLQDAQAVQAISTANVEQFAKASRDAARVKGVEMPYTFVAAFVFLAATIVGVFYASSALHSERKDRTILFWKSLPVSDRTTVLAKVFVPMVVLPAAIFTITFVTHLLMLAWSTVLLLLHGVAPGELYRFLHFPYMWVALARGLIIVALWHAPVIAWLMLASGWARRVPFLWAVTPWVAIPLVEWLALRTHHTFDFAVSRLNGGYLLAFGGGDSGPVERWSDLDLAPLLHPGLWGGLIVAAGLIAAAVRLRRYRDPI